MKYIQNVSARYQKRRKVPIHLQLKVKIELTNLLKKGYIKNFQSCSNQNFVSPIVITAKEDQSKTLVPDSNVMNKSIHNNKNKMPNIGSLLQKMSQKVSSSAPNDMVYFTTIHLQYAYNHFNLLLDRTGHSNFNFVSSDLTGTYCFKTGLYRSTDLTAEIQKPIDYTLIGLHNTFYHFDNLFIVTQHQTNVDETTTIVEAITSTTTEITINAGIVVKSAILHIKKLPSNWLMSKTF